MKDFEERVIKLVEYAMTIRMCGERAPGGDENWRQWERDADHFLHEYYGAG